MGGAWKERRGGVLEGVDAPMHTLNLLEEGEGEKKRYLPLLFNVICHKLQGL